MAVTPPTRPVPVEAFGVVLRPYEPGDAQDVAAALGDPDIARWNPAPGGPAGAEQLMAQRNDWSTADHVSWAVAEAGRLVGSVSVHRIDADQEHAEVGYWVAPWARRRGVATRALLAATGFCFGELGLHRLYLYHAVANAGSCAVARSAGFVHEGTLRQSYRYPDGARHDEHLHARLVADGPVAADGPAPAPR